MFESVVDFIGVEFVTFTNAFAQEVVTAFFREYWDLISWDRVNMISEAKLSLNLSLAIFALVDSFSEKLWIFFEKEKREASY